MMSSTTNENAEAAEKKTRTRRELPAYTLPPTGDALIPAPKVAAALDGGVSTVWYRVATDPTFPRPIKLGSRCTRFSVAQLRDWIAGKAASSSAPADGAVGN